MAKVKTASSKAPNTANKAAAKKARGKATKKIAERIAKKPARQPVSPSAKKAAKPAAAARPRRRIAVRRSAIHGNGVFALVDIPKGERIIEYKARRITWAQADRWYADDESKPSHTFLFTLDDKYVLDGNKEGNSARWINHSCNPNCESDNVDGHIWIEALRNIKAGEELSYDYNITLETPHTPAEKRRWPCRCGTRDCRGTLLGKKR